VHELPRAEWHTLLPSAHPGYVCWEESEANLGRLRENAHAQGEDRRQSPPRESPALLQGLAVCGRCGERMTVRYYSRGGRIVPAYLCQKDGIANARPICQHVLGWELDRALGALLVETVTPLALEVALAVQDELNSRAEEVDRSGSRAARPFSPVRDAVIIEARPRCWKGGGLPTSARI
jgi:hypothetical protein